MLKGALFDFGDTILVERQGKSLREMVPRKTKGLDRALRGLRDCGLRLGIVANTITSRTGDIRNVLRRMGIERHFDAVVTSLDEGACKPDPKPFLKALDALGLKPSEALMVGNQLDTDVRGANRLGMVSVWFHWNDRYRPSDGRAEDEPDYIVSNMADLPRIVMGLMPPRSRAKAEGLGEIAARVRRCRWCALWKGRMNAVPGEGLPSSRLMLVGEAPGRTEDSSGRPFVGAAGRVLAEALRENGLDRGEVFITSILKCRPPGNRKPKKGEMDACRPHLTAQVEALRPRVIVALGSSGFEGLTGKKVGQGGLAEGSKKAFSVSGVPVLLTYHPAACLYNPGLKAQLGSDLSKALGLDDRKF